ncbi:hypothetical protein PPACK8108_LOCUS12976 [Phakopsora pachyrhizi]|uniref:Uncharacterized protein n=1 Tax=Phakopsora pachyrhizi TaxID=170000 RepID=A0AAV0B4U4_PHAPC|nr:hypothetical protein PPACK8108_LOCUS12976 [Phakopsora pachyrhizi]
MQFIHLYDMDSDLLFEKVTSKEELFVLLPKVWNGVRRHKAFKRWPRLSKCLISILSQMTLLMAAKEEYLKVMFLLGCPLGWPTIEHERREKQGSDHLEVHKEFSGEDNDGNDSFDETEGMLKREDDVERMVIRNDVDVVDTRLKKKESDCSDD